MKYCKPVSMIIIKENIELEKNEKDNDTKFYEKNNDLMFSYRESSIAISKTEAEIVAASECANESIWLKTIYSRIMQLRNHPVLMVDNEATIRLPQNSEFHKLTEGEIVVQKIEG